MNESYHLLDKSVVLFLGRLSPSVSLHLCVCGSVREKVDGHCAHLCRSGSCD